MVELTLRRVVSEVFGITPDEVTDQVSPDTVDDWDSLSHLRLITALEEAFSLKFENAEIMDMTTVGAIRDIVERKVAAAK